VRLPKEFRLEGDRVRISRVGKGLFIEPIEPIEQIEQIEARTKESTEAWFARLDSLRGDSLFPEARKQNLAPIREYFD